MAALLRFFKKKKKENFLILDIGTEAVKAVILREKEGKISILQSSLEYFEDYGGFNSQNPERKVWEKAILKTFQNLNLAEAKKRTNFSVILGLPADFLKARVISQNFKRAPAKKIIDEKEAKEIFQMISAKAREAISLIYSQNSGILPSELQFINLKILEMKIDGYRVPTLQRYDGGNLDFKILATFLSKNHLKEAENVHQTFRLKENKIVHQAEGLPSFFSKISGGIFLDVGGEITQIFLVRNNLFENIDEFRTGGEIFSRALAEKLGLTLPEARILKERYARRELSQESSERIKEIIYSAVQTWFKNLKSKLKEMKTDGLLPSPVFLYGGSSQLPEISEILRDGDWSSFHFAGQPEIGILRPSDFKIIIEEGKNLNNPQNTPSLLIYDAQKSY